MWTWEQSTGRLYSPDGRLCAVGYSGAPEGKNRPEVQSVHNFGPIPQGLWVITGPPLFGTSHGPYVLRLMPEVDTEVFGRGGFLIHGDLISNPGAGSLGCVILARSIREQIWESGDRTLNVVAVYTPQVMASAPAAGELPQA
jgi:hypothetical protein